MNNNYNACLFASSTFYFTFSFQDIYYIIVGIGILISAVISLIQCIKSSKSVKIDKDTEDTLKDIDDKIKR